MNDFSFNTRSFEAWRNAARPFLAAGKKPEELLDGQTSTPNAPTVVAAKSRGLRLPRMLMDLLENLALFRDDGRWELMYRLSWRTVYENTHLLADPADRDVSSAMSMDRAVRRDLHKMHAFVRFREVVRDDQIDSYFAWFEPQHEILRKGAGFFVKRFPNMPWTIATPDGAAVWDMKCLRFADSDSVGERPRGDAQEDLWRTYYRSICNVARINADAMQREMPQFYWRNLPEASEIGALMREGQERFAQAHEQSDREHPTTAKSVQRVLEAARLPDGSVQNCRACDLWRTATQAVEGKGPKSAKIMLVGEQPGDEEDLRGAPFVGPAGKVLDAALDEAGIQRAGVYVTNAVKHFKWEPRGKRRLHKKPNVSEVRACSIWLAEEIAAVKPRVIVALGATALGSLVGSSYSIDAARKLDLAHSSAAKVLATYHPSAILRADDGRKDELRAFLIADLKRAATLAAK